MNYIKHIGIYVKNLEEMTMFYSKALEMKIICSNYTDKGILYEQLYGTPAVVEISKLITEYGSKTGQGEMIELIKVVEGATSLEVFRNVEDIGLSHVSIGVNNIDDAVQRINMYGGMSITEVIDINGKKCCFCKDIEGNVLELIQ